MDHDARAQLERRERYLSAVVEIERRLLEARHDADLYGLVLPVLREAADASRVYVFENHTGADGRLRFSQVAEVTAPGIEPFLDDPALRDLSYDDVAPRWRETLQAGRPISGVVAGFPESERAYLEPQGILSLLALPLTVEHGFHGFIGFDDCHDPDPWGEPEVELLRAAAAALSVTIEWSTATRALLDSERQQRSYARMMRLMCDTVPDLLWAKDLERRFLFTNTATCEKLLLAEDTAEPVGKDDMYFVDRIRGEMPERGDWHTFGELCVDSDSVIMESGVPQRFDESGNVRGEHLFLDVYKAPMFDDEGRMIGTVGCGRDVTDERLARQRLVELEAGKTATFDAMPDIHLRIARDGTFVEAHASAPARMVLPPDQVIGRTVEEVLPPHVAGPALESIAAALAGESPSFEYALEVGGEERHFEARVVPCGADDVLAVVRDVTELQLKRDEAAATAERLRGTLLDTVRAMGAMVQLRDPYTAGHEHRVAALAEAVAGVLGFDEDSRQAVLVAGEIHDIGKIGIPAETLSKPRRLSPDERRLVEEHPTRGHEILAGINFDWPVAEIVHQHHERLDGSGYPRGLRGGEILPEALVLAAADVLEAMSSHRPYRPALGVEAGLEELRAGAGVRFDEQVVAACEEVVARGLVDLSEPHPSAEPYLT